MAEDKGKDSDGPKRDDGPETDDLSDSRDLSKLDKIGGGGDDESDD
jgi:hypothetical protein